MSFYSPEVVEKIKSLEGPPKVYKNIFTRTDIAKLLEIEEKSINNRMVDREDSRKTKFDLMSKVGDIINPKIERVLDRKVNVGDFPAHFIKNKYPLRVHADMGKDPSLVPHKNILIPLEVKGDNPTHTILFNQRWYGKSSLFSAAGNTSADHFFKDKFGKFIHVKDSSSLLNLIEKNLGKTIEINGGKFDCSTKTVEEIKALLKQSRYSDRTNKHITSDVPFNKLNYERYLSHQPYEDLKSLSIDRAITWYPGDIIVFDRSTIHCASNFLKEGVSEKTAIAMFTIWK